MVKSFLMPNASYITIGEPGGGKKEIEQYVELIDPLSKSERLGKVLRNISAPIIIFVN
jgi:ATP-dependent RNA helicase DDX23/PRP28